MDDTPTPRIIAYQAWVRGEYVKELQATHGHLAPQISLCGRDRHSFVTLPSCKAPTPAGSASAQQLAGSASTTESVVEYDPIVSVQEEATFFRRFIDESAYARVQLPHSVCTDRTRTGNHQHRLQRFASANSREHSYRPPSGCGL